MLLTPPTCNLLNIDLPKMLTCFRNKSRKEEEENYFFMRNGAEVLEQVITSFNGHCNPIRTYSIKDLNKATNNFRDEGLLCWSPYYRLYKGVHEHHRISVKKFDGSSRLVQRDHRLKFIANEVAIASQMSNHKNVLKLLGCCVETEFPILVYEFPKNGSLRDALRYTKDKKLPWLSKLRIATQVAHAVAYLHYGFSKMIVHRDLMTQHIFLDQDYVAKLSEFQTSLVIPEGETHIDADVYGTGGYLAPELLMYGRHTEKTDVFSFGTVLCEILVGKTCWVYDVLQRRSSSSNSEDESWVGSTSGEQLTKLCKTYLELEDNIFFEENREQVLEWLKLIENCLKTNPDDRPNMTQVTKTLRSIQSI